MSEQRERWVIGATRLTTIVESETSSIPVELFFPDASASDVAKATWLVPDVAGDDGAITFRVQSFVVEHNDKTIVIDPCVGNGKQRNLFFWNDLQLPWLERFTAAGFDLVIHTHLHEDHIGGTPTSPMACGCRLFRTHATSTSPRNWTGPRETTDAKAMIPSPIPSPRSWTPASPGR